MEKADSVWFLFRYYGLARVSVSVKIVNGFGAEWPKPTGWIVCINCLHSSVTFKRLMLTGRPLIVIFTRPSTASDHHIWMRTSGWAVSPCTLVWETLGPVRPGRQGWYQITVHCLKYHTTRCIVPSIRRSLSKFLVGLVIVIVVIRLNFQSDHKKAIAYKRIQKYVLSICRRSLSYSL